MADAKERLSRLIELAGENAPEKQRALAFELSDLLSDWPRRYPGRMREPFEVLLEKIFGRLDGPSRRMIAGRLANHAGTALTLLNELYLDVPSNLQARILQRNEESTEPFEAVAQHADEAQLIVAARQSCGRDFAGAFGEFLRIAVPIAERILADTNGDALAVACKGACLARATFSALALLAVGEARGRPGARFERLSSFDVIPANGAQRLLAHWRQHGSESPSVAAE